MSAQQDRLGPACLSQNQTTVPTTGGFIAFVAREPRGCWRGWFLTQ